MRYFIIAILLSCICCKTKVVTEDCENQFIEENNMKVNILNDFFYVEEINQSSDTMNFNNSGSDTFFRIEGAYILKEIDKEYLDNYKKGIFINNSSLVKKFFSKNGAYIENVDFNDKTNKIRPLEIITKLNIREKKNFKPIVLSYKKCYLKIKYVYLGTGCVYVPIYKNKKLKYINLRVPINLIIALDEQ